MGVLDSILAYKAQKDAQANADINAIPQGIAAFTAAKQVAQKSQLDMLTNQISAAKSGLDIVQEKSGGYSLKQNPDLLESMSRNIVSYNPTTQQVEVVGRMGKNDKLRNTTTVEDVKNKENAKYEGTKESSARAFDLRKEFQNIETVKDYQVIKNQVSSMDALLSKIDTDKDSALALDQGLITMFNKITDPTSVVRESEYDRTPSNLSLANRFGGAVEKLKKGGAGLTSDDRKSLVFGAKVIADSRGKIYNETLSNYENLSDKFGVERELVTSGYGRHKDFNSAEPSGELKVGGDFQGSKILKVTKVKS